MHFHERLLVFTFFFVFDIKLVRGRTTGRRTVDMCNTATDDQTIKPKKICIFVLHVSMVFVPVRKSF